MKKRNSAWKNGIALVLALLMALPALPAYGLELQEIYEPTQDYAALEFYASKQEAKNAAQGMGGDPISVQLAHRENETIFLPEAPAETAEGHFLGWYFEEGTSEYPIDGNTVAGTNLKGGEPIKCYPLYGRKLVFKDGSGNIRHSALVKRTTSDMEPEVVQPINLSELVPSDVRSWTDSILNTRTEIVSWSYGGSTYSASAASNESHLLPYPAADAELTAVFGTETNGDTTITHNGERPVYKLSYTNLANNYTVDADSGAYMAGGSAVLALPVREETTSKVFQGWQLLNGEGAEVEGCFYAQGESLAIPSDAESTVRRAASESGSDKILTLKAVYAEKPAESAEIVFHSNYPAGSGDNTTWTTTLELSAEWAYLDSVEAQVTKFIDLAAANAVRPFSLTGYMLTGWQVGDAQAVAVDGACYYYEVPDPLPEGKTAADYPTRFSADVKSENHLYAIWEEIEVKPTSYTIEYYKQNLENDEYGAEPFETETGDSTTGTTINATEKNYEGFVLNTERSEAARELTDSANVMKVYYDRRLYKVKYDYMEGDTNKPSGYTMPVDENTYKYGAAVTLAAGAGNQSGYDFNGWFLDPAKPTEYIEESSISMPACEGDTLTIYGSFRPAADVPYNVEYYRETLTEGVYEQYTSGVESGGLGSIGQRVRARLYDWSAEGYERDTEHEGYLEEGVIPDPGSDADNPVRLTLKLYYKRKSYNIDYYFVSSVNGAELWAADTGNSHRLGVPVSFESDFGDMPEFGGYSFKGWEHSPDSAQLSYSDTLSGETRVITGIRAMPAEDLTLRAVYTPRSDLPVTIEYYLESAGGEYPAAASYTRTLNIGTLGVKFNAISEQNRILSALPANDALIEELAHYTQDESKAEEAESSAALDGSGTPTVKLYFKRNVHTLRFSVSGATGNSDVRALVDGNALYADRELRYGQSFSLPDKPDMSSASGWLFRGWSFTTPGDVTGNEYSANPEGGFAGGSDSLSFTMPDRDVSVQGSFIPDGAEAVSYIVRLHLSGTEDGTVADSVSQSSAEGHSGEKLHVNGGTGGEAEGYDLLHYELPEGFELDLGHEGELISTDSLTEGFVFELYLKRRSYGIAYSWGEGAPSGFVLPSGLNDGSKYEYGGKAYLKDELPTAESVPTGYEFAGWTVAGENIITEGTGESARRYIVMPAHEVEAKGSFAAGDVEYSVRYYKQNVNGVGYAEDADARETLSAKRGESVSAGSLYAKSFEGFSYDEGNTANKDNITLGVDPERNIIARYYSRNQYEVSYDIDPTIIPNELIGKVLTPAAQTNIYCGATVTLAEIDAGDNYSFQWLRPEDSDIVIENGRFTMPARHLLFTGSFAPKAQYTIEHYFESLPEIGGSPTYPEEPTYTETVSGGIGQLERTAEHLYSERTGFTFMSELSSRDSYVENGMTLYIYYARNYRLLDFAYEGNISDSLPEARSYYYGQRIGSIINSYEPAEREDYTFAWTVDGATVTDSYTMPPYAITAVGKFTQNTKYAGSGNVDRGGGGFSGEAEVVVEGLDTETTIDEPIVRDTETVDPLTGRKGDPVHGFLDVGWGDWYAEAVDYISESGLMTGTGFMEFSPKENMNRAMMVEVLFRMAKLESGNEGLTPSQDLLFGLSDVDVYSWYAEALEWSLEEGIVTGYRDDTFDPSGQITREQIAVVLYRYAQRSGAEKPGSDALSKAQQFTDYEDIGGYALEAIAWCVDKGIITGRTDGSVDPKGLATRAELAAMIQRYLSPAEATAEATAEEGN